MARTPLYQEILEYIDFAPDTTTVPVPVAAIYKGISRDEIKKRYELVKIGKRRQGVVLGHLRGKQTVTA
jgi:hypothetical protein